MYMYHEKRTLASDTIHSTLLHSFPGSLQELLHRGSDCSVSGGTLGVPSLSLSPIGVILCGGKGRNKTLTAVFKARPIPGRSFFY